MLAAWSFSILYQENCALVVLEQTIVLNLVSFGFHKVWRPTDRGHEVVGTHDFRFRRALGILSFCLVKLTMGNPLPKNRTPPLSPCMLGWTANAASTHHFKMLAPLALRIRGSVRVPLRYFIRWTSLFQSSLWGACTLVVKNAIAVQVLVLAHLVAYSVLATRLWNSTAFCFRQELLVVFVNLKKVVRSSTWLCTTSLGLCLIEIIKDLVNVVEHWYVHLAMNGVVQSHSEILVDSSCADCHLSRSILKDTFIFLPGPINHVIVSSAAAGTQFAVIHI